jgi:hypothetical protein
MSEEPDDTFEMAANKIESLTVEVKDAFMAGTKIDYRLYYPEELEAEFQRWKNTVPNKQNGNLEK